MVDADSAGDDDWLAGPERAGSGLVSRALGWFVPEELRADVRLNYKARVFVGLTLGVMATSLVGAVLEYVVVGSVDIIVALCLLCVPLYGLTLASLRLTGRLEFAAGALVLIATMILTLMVWMLGGTRSGVLWWYALPLLLGFYLGGGRSGAVVLVAIVAITAGLQVFDDTWLVLLPGLERIEPGGPGTWPHMAVVWMYFVTVGAIVWLADKEASAAHARLERARVHAVAQDRLAQIGMLTAGVAHEINNPLAYMRGNLDLLGELFEEGMSDEGDEELARGLHRDIARGTEAIADIVGELGVFSRRPSETLDAGVGTVDVGEALRGAMAMARPHLGPGTELSARIDDELPAARGERGRLSQVLLNLLINAMHATADERESRIDVHAFADGGRPVVTVSDTGPGIDPAELQHIFEPFFTTKAPGEGTGLGLSISREILRRWGARLDVESSRGAGATFTVALEPQCSG